MFPVATYPSLLFKPGSKHEGFWSADCLVMNEQRLLCLTYESMYLTAHPSCVYVCLLNKCGLQGLEIVHTFLFESEFIT